MKFAQLFRKYRNRSGLSLTDVAKRTDYVLSFISTMEKGTRKPASFEVVDRLAYIFRLTEPERAEFLQAAFYERMSEDDKKYLDELNRLFNEGLGGKPIPHIKL